MNHDLTLTRTDSGHHGVCACGVTWDHESSRAVRDSHDHHIDGLKHVAELRAQLEEGKK